MAYDPPALSVLVTSVSRDLRDPFNRTFSPLEVADFIRAGVVEVSAVNPFEEVVSLDFLADTAQYPCELTDAFRVEVFADGVYAFAIPSNTSDDVGSQGGWELFGGYIYIPWAAVARMTETVNDLRVWGYRPRDLPIPVQTSPGPPAVYSDPKLEGDAQVEQGVRTYALLEGYQRLVNSRALFQQWTQSPGNSDVSATQLTGFAGNYEQQWQRIRQQMRRLRRR